MENLRERVFGALERYNGYIDMAAELVSQKRGIYNQFDYLKHIESVAPERVFYLESAKRRCSARLAELYNAEIAMTAEQRFVDAYERAQLINRIKTIDENLEGFNKLPHETEDRRKALEAELDGVQNELMLVEESLSKLGTYLDKFLEQRTFKGRGLTSTDLAVIDVLNGGIKKYKVQKFQINMAIEEEM